VHFSLYGPREWRGPGRDALFKREQEQAEVERLNLLYVAMTRARQALFVSGIRQAGELDDTSWLGQLDAALEKTEMNDLPEMAWLDTPPPSSTDTRPPAPPESAPAWPAIGTRRQEETPEAAFGTLLHAWLEHRSAGKDDEAIRALLRVEDSRAETIAATARRMLSHPELAAAFDPARHVRAHNELEFLDEEGRAARMDRLVEFEQEVWILDYKSGGLDEPDPDRRAHPHREQMERYRHAAQALFPHKPVRTALVFADGLVHWL